MNPAIELWRGMTAWMVLTAHYAVLVADEQIWINFLMFFAFGVNFFFVITGFVFAKTIYAAQPPALAAFAIRRFFRIYPLYVCSLLLYYIAAPAHPDKVEFLLKHLLFLHTTESPQIAYFFNTAYWTLPVEMSFYLLVPLLALLQSRYSAALFGLFIIGLGIKFLIAAYSTPLDQFNIFTVLRYHIVGILPEFLLGVFLYQFLRYQAIFSKLLGYSLAGIGFLSLLSLSQFYMQIGIHGIYTNIWLKAYFDIACAIGFAAILLPMLIFFKPQGLQLHICLWLGNLSYGVYLLHNLPAPLFNKIGISLTGWWAYGVYASFTLVMAIIFYLLIEQPLRELGRRLARQVAPKH